MATEKENRLATLEDYRDQWPPTIAGSALAPRLDLRDLIDVLWDWDQEAAQDVASILVHAMKRKGKPKDKPDKPPGQGGGGGKPDKPPGQNKPVEGHMDVEDG